MWTVLLCLFVLAGCAAKRQPPCAVPQIMKERMNAIGARVTMCISPTQPLPYYIACSNEPNAYIYEKKIIFTEGMFAFDSDVLKFVMAHEIAHDKAGHLAKIRAASLVTTGAMMVLNAIVPGSGILNYAVNPAVTRNFNKSQELEADRLASEAMSCLGYSIPEQVEIVEKLKTSGGDGGGFWSTHPAWDERIEAIRALEK